MKMIILKTFKEKSIFKVSKYEVMLPFRPNFGFILVDYILPETRLTSLQENFTEDSNLLFEYNKTMNDYMIVGIIEKLPLNENFKSETSYYLPQRVVIKSERETTKLRLVFDASWKQPDKPFLNNLLYAGPCFSPKLY